MQAQRMSDRRPLTLLDVIDVVTRCSRTSEETAAVINHLLRTSKLRFANAPSGPGFAQRPDAWQGALTAVRGTERPVTAPGK